MTLPDLDKVVGFDWDEGNFRKNEKKHYVGRVEAEQIFLNEPLLFLLDEKHSRQEKRFHGLGRTSLNRFLHVTFTLRSNDTLIRIISARDMHKKERKIYEKEITGYLK